MKNISDIEVRYMQRRQVSDYSPVEAEVTLHAVIGEGEDATGVAAKLLGEAGAAVRVAIGLKDVSGAAVADAADQNRAKAFVTDRGAPPKVPAPKAVETAAEMPDIQEALASGDKEVEDSAADFIEEQAEVSGDISDEDLLHAAQAAAAKVGAPVVKELIAKEFKVVRLGQIAPVARPAFIKRCSELTVEKPAEKKGGKAKK